jgi:hypothetical protein
MESALACENHFKEEIMKLTSFGTSLFFSVFFPFSLAAFADTDVVDQQQLTFNGMADAFGQQDPMAQIFTAGISGALDKISVQAAPCYDAWNKSCFFNIQIQTVDGNGNPSGAVIGQGRGREPQPPSNGNAFGWTDVTLDQPAQVQAGTRYAMVLRADWWMQVVFGTGTGFNGYAKHFQNGWGGYGNSANLVFKTWVIPAPLTTTFQATIQSDTNNQCLIFGGNGQNPYPQRYLWGNGTSTTNCGFNTQQDMLSNKQAVWKFVQIQGNQYVMTNSSNGKEQCLIFGGNGNNTYPERYLWGNGSTVANCGFNNQQDLLNNKQAIWIVEQISGNKFTIKNASNGLPRCLIFGGNGNNVYPERYVWGNGLNPTNCGFASPQDLLNNRQAVWTISKI